MCSVTKFKIAEGSSSRKTGRGWKFTNIVRGLKGASFTSIKLTEKGVKDWENEKCCVNMSYMLMFLQFLRVLASVHE